MPSSWEQTLQTLIAGTDRLPLKVEGVVLPAGEVLAELASLQLLRKAGMVFSDAPALPAPLATASGARLPEEIRRDLQLILSGIFKQALPEFVRLLKQKGAEWPPEYLPEALDICLQEKNTRNFLLPLLNQSGTRAHWLAQQHPAWKTLFADAEVDWATAGFRERYALLARLRAEDPQEAVRLLMETWTGEAAAHRVDFLALLRTGLSAADIPFLEGALSDRSREVRLSACRLLSLLPGNKVFQSLEQAAVQCLAVWPDIDGGHWWKELAPFIDPTAKMEDRALYGRALDLLLSCLPLGIAAHPTPATFLSDAVQLQRAGMLLEGIAGRANLRWQEALVRYLDQHPHDGLKSEPALASVLSGMSDADWNRAMTSFVSRPALLDNRQEPIPVALLSEERIWGKELVASCLYQIGSKAQQSYSFPTGLWPQILERTAYQGKVQEILEVTRALPELSVAYGAWRQHLDRFHAVLRFRVAMQEHFL